MIAARPLVIGAVIMLVACDKAENPYNECAKLESTGKLSEAVSACDTASNADPTTKFGKLALAKGAEIQAKLNEIVPPTVTAEWCARLRNRLQTRLSSNAEAKYGGSGGDVGTIIHDNVLNVEWNCRQAVGQPTTGLWTCRWNETLDTGEQCDAMEKRR